MIMQLPNILAYSYLTIRGLGCNMISKRAHRKTLHLGNWPSIYERASFCLIAGKELTEEVYRRATDCRALKCQEDMEVKNRT